MAIVLMMVVTVAVMMEARDWCRADWWSMLGPGRSEQQRTGGPWTSQQIVQR